jgi:hypothetical protein
LIAVLREIELEVLVVLEEELKVIEEIILIEQVREVQMVVVQLEQLITMTCWN